jgi:hypothetical protein
LSAAAIARPVPVLPLVGSTIVPPGFSLPSRSAASTRAIAARSLIEPPGLSASIFATSCGREPLAEPRQSHQRRLADGVEYSSPLRLLRLETRSAWLPRYSRIGGHGPAQAAAGPTGRVRNGMGA